MTDTLSHRLTRENEELKAHIKKLEDNEMRTLEESIYLKRLEVYNGQCDLEINSEIIPLQAAQFARFFDIQGATNNLTFQFQLTDDAPDNPRTFEISIQKVGEKTMADLRREERER